MKDYFQLQSKMLSRQLTHWGIEPLIGYCFTIAAFLIISVKLFEKTQYAAYIYLAVVILIVMKFSEANRNEFLKLCYKKTTQYLKLRLIENVSFSLPFICFLIYKEQFLITMLLLVIVCLLAIIDLKGNYSFVLPTPFYKYPFEFATGFRANFFMFFIAYFLTIMAISVGNFNLGIFSLLLVFLSCMNYYTDPENEFYVWVFSLSPKEFIKYKFKNIVSYTTILSLPVLVSLPVYFYKEIDIIIGFQLLGYLFVLTVMLAKYSDFPQKITIKRLILFGFSMWLPPLLLIVIPYLYIESLKKLKEIL